MSTRALLYLLDERLSVWFWHAGRLSAGPEFPADEQGLASFSAWLVGHIDQRFTLLADVVDEGFHLETLPHVSGSDRRALIDRKLSQLFYGSPYTTTIALGREQGGRRDDRLLMLALTRPSQIKPWMQILQAKGVAVTGISSTALLAPSLLRGTNPPRLLLVNLTPAGIRQTLIDENHLRFSRLTALVDATAWTDRLPIEVQKTYQYLVTQHVVPRGTQLLVMLLASVEDLDALRKVCHNNEHLHFIEMDLAVAARQAGLVSAPTDSDALPLLLHRAARHRGEPQFAPPADRLDFLWYRARQAVLISGFAALCAGLLFAAKTLFDCRALDNESGGIRLDAQSALMDYEHQRSRLPKLPTTLESLQSGIKQINQMENRAKRLAPDLISASHALERTHDIELQKIEWALTPPNASIRSSEGSELILRANFGTPSLGRREMLEAIEHLAEALRREGAAEVTVLKLPFDFTSAQTLRSSESEDRGFSLRARFTTEAQ